MNEAGYIGIPSLELPYFMQPKENEMPDAEIVLQKIKDFVRNRYDYTNGARTSQWSHGNSDDVFYDGELFGECMVLWELSKLLAMNLREPEEPESVY